MSWRMELALFVGTQGSGKTSFYAVELIHTHVRISRDLVRTKHRERRLFETCLDLQQPFVLDNTNPTRAVRAPWIALARAREVPVVGYWFDVPLADALARNAGRAGARRIPDSALESTYARLEPPQLDEGFERVLVVRTLADVATGQHRYLIDAPEQ
jgi:tRNA uridine 5-carbamoylmethylation protein Kti12